MTLTVAELRRLTGWMQAAGITALDWTFPDGRLRLVLAAEPASPASGRQVMAMAPGPGRFASRHPDRDTALATPGARVRAGDVLGLVQVGPVYSPVTAPCDGTLLALLVEDGALVGYETPVMALEETPA